MNLDATFMPLHLIGLAIALAAAQTSSQHPGPLQVVPTVDLQRYMGTWYEIARLPNRFQRACVGDVTATYALRTDGRIDVTNRCREADGEMREAAGVARRVDGQPPSVLEVRFAPAFLSFLPMVWGDYHIIELGPDYDHAVIGTPDRAYLWILERRTAIDDALYDELLSRARDQGFDVSALVKTSHTTSGSASRSH